MSHDLPLLPLVLDDVPAGLRLALAQEGVPTRDRRDGPAEGRFLLFDSRTNRSPRVEPGQTPLDVDPLRDDPEGDPMAALTDCRAARSQWHVAGWTLHEDVARVDKRAARRRLMTRLRAAVERAEGLWLRVSPYPSPYRSVFTLRIDHDEREIADLHRLMDALAGHEDATSHFVNATAYDGCDEAWRRLRGLDVGSHGYWHHTYRTVEENVRNIRRGIETIRDAGFEPSGFTAPHGSYHTALAEAMRQLNLTHSGEFGLAYDELPFFPEGSDVLQIPVHPICLGLFLDAVVRDDAKHPAETRDARMAAAARAAGDYLVELVGDRYEAGEPVLLYGHPNGRLGRYPDVVRRVVAAVDGLPSIWKTTATRLAAWWRARLALRLSVRREENGCVVTAEGPWNEWPTTIEYCRGRHVARMRIDGPTLRFSPEAVAYEDRAVRPSVQPVRIDRPEGIKSHLRRAIDWERVTPLAEIAAAGWRNRTKRMLRRFL